MGVICKRSKGKKKQFYNTWLHLYSKLLIYHYIIFDMFLPIYALFSNLTVNLFFKKFVKHNNIDQNVYQIISLNTIFFEVIFIRHH